MILLECCGKRGGFRQAVIAPLEAGPLVARAMLVRISHMRKRVRPFMWPFRWLRTMARWLLRCFSLRRRSRCWSAILVDEGPTGEARASSHFFPLVLWLFDDFAWTCARNSLIFASLVSVGSLVLGVGLRCALARVWLRGRRPRRGGPGCRGGLAGLPRVRVDGAFRVSPSAGRGRSHRSMPEARGRASNRGPAFRSGSRGSGRRCRRERRWWRWLASLHFGGWTRRGTRRRGWPGRARSGLCGTLLADRAARGGPRRRTGLSARHGRARAPLVLGLRRTLAFQIVDAATGVPIRFRAAVWALMAGLLGLCGWLVFRWKGALRYFLIRQAAVAAPEPTRRVRRGSPWLSVVSALLLAIWTIVAWLPVVGLFRLVSRGGEASRPADATLASGILAAIPQLRDPVLFQVLLDSAVFGLEVACGLLLIAWVAGLGSRGRRGDWRRWFRPVAALPPLVLGVGVLALCWLAALASRSCWTAGKFAPRCSVGDLAAAIDTRQNIRGSDGRLLSGSGSTASLLPEQEPAPCGCCGREPQIDSCYEAAILRPRLAAWRAWRLAKPGVLSRGRAGSCSCGRPRRQT